MKNQSKLFLILITISFHSFGQNNEPITTFANLDSKLTIQQKQIIKDYETRIKIVNSKDYKYLVHEQISLVSDMYDIPDITKIRLELHEYLYNRYGFSFKGSQTQIYLNTLYFELAGYYSRGEYFNFHPEKALIIHFSRSEYKDFIKYSYDSLIYILSNDKFFPKRGLLEDTWLTYDKNKDQISIDQAIKNYELQEEKKYYDEEYNEDEIFNNGISCENLKSILNKSQALTIQLQKEMLKNNTVTKQELTNAYKQIHDILGDSYKVSFNMSSVSVNELVSLFFDVVPDYFNRTIEKTNYIENNSILLYANNISGNYAFTQLLNHLNSDVKCDNNAIKLVSNSLKNAQTKSIFIPGFMIKKEISKDKDGNTFANIQWDNKTSYRGGYKNNAAEGLGEYIFMNNKNKVLHKLSGKFKNGLLNGLGSEIAYDENFETSGHYKNGLLDGKGHEINQKEFGYFVNYNGLFKDGIFAGQGQVYFRRSEELTREEYQAERAIKQNIKNNTVNLNNYIKYEGEIKNHKAHGKGHCYMSEIDYPCEFYKGYLIGVDNTVILPDYISL